MKTTVIGILGSRLDHQSLGKRRHSRWRPSVGILMPPDFPVDEFVLIHHADEAELAGITLRDLLARINLWTYELPDLRHRLEDLEANIEYELQQFTRKVGHKVSFNKAARERKRQPV